jgi:hypothetical protein
MVGGCSYLVRVRRRRSPVRIEPRVKVARVINNASPKLQIFGAAAEDPAL